MEHIIILPDNFSQEFKKEVIELYEQIRIIIRNEKISPILYALCSITANVLLSEKEASIEELTEWADSLNRSLRHACLEFRKAERI